MKWLEKARLEDVVSPFAATSKKRLLQECKEFAHRVALPGNGLMAEADWDERYLREATDYLDEAWDLVKCHAHGYGSPDEMLREEPQLRRDMERFDQLERDNKRHRRAQIYMENEDERGWRQHAEHPQALAIARKIVDFAHRAASEDGPAKPLLLRNLDRGRRLAVHKMVEHMQKTR